MTTIAPGSGIVRCLTTTCRNRKDRQMGKFHRVGAMWSRKDQGKLPSIKIDREKLLGILAVMDGDLFGFVSENKFKEKGDKKPDFDLVILQKDEDTKPEGGFTPEPEEPF